MAFTPPTMPSQIGRYRIIKPLGQGGMGSVFLAQDTELDRLVALKVPNISTDDSRVRERFNREARLAATLRHPHICPLFDIGEFEGIPYLTMAYIEGKSLSDFVRSKPVTQRQAALLVRKVALALQEAHQHGVIHRDLKPANVMIDRRGEPTVMDFGLARRVDRSDARITQTGEGIGTPAYMPPEQISATSDNMGPACDIYSLGVILYELLTSRLPFTGNIMAVLAQIANEPPPPPSNLQPDIHPALEAICLRAMAKKPEERQSSMRELAGELEEYLRGKVPTARKTSRPKAVTTQAPGRAVSMTRGRETVAQASQPQKDPLAFGTAPQHTRRRGIPAWTGAVGGVVAFLLVVVLMIWISQGTMRFAEKVQVPESNPVASQTNPEEKAAPQIRAPTGTTPAAPAASAPSQRPAASTPAPAELERLQGEWIVVSEEYKGKPIPDGEIQRQAKTLVFDGDRLIFNRQGKDRTLTSVGTVRVVPLSIDFTGTDYFGQPREFRGIFELTGDTLRLAYPNTNTGLVRPTAFASSANSDTLVIVARRKTTVPSESAEAGWTSLFNGKDLTGWKMVGSNRGWWVKDGEIFTDRGRPGVGEPGWLMTEREYQDFILSLEFNLRAQADTGVAFRCDPAVAYPLGQAEIQIVDEQDPERARLLDQEPHRRTSLCSLASDRTVPSLELDRWHTMTVELRGRRLKVTVNDTVSVDTELDQHVAAARKGQHGRAGVWRQSGPIALQKMLTPTGVARFRNIRIKDLSNSTAVAASSNTAPAPSKSPSGPNPELVCLRELPSDQNKSGPWLSADGRTLFWADKQGPVHHIWRAVRKGPGQAFTDAVKHFGGHDVTFSADLTEMIRVDYDPKPDAGQKFAVFTATGSVEQGYASPHRKLTEMAGLGFVAAPCLSADGLTLYAEQFGNQSLPPNVRFRRMDRSARWGKPEAVPLSGLAKGGLRFPFISPDNKYLFGNNDQSPSGMVVLTSVDGGQTFGSPRPIEVPGAVVKGKFPRYSPPTNELFFSESTTANTAELYLIRNFDPSR